MSWKIDENIFHQKCPKHHFLVTESVSCDACDDISSKNDEKSCFFLPVCHCGTLYSKSRMPCTRPNTALWRPAARQLCSDGSSRCLGVGSSPLDMLSSWCFSTAPPKRSSWEGIGEELTRIHDLVPLSGRSGKKRPKMPLRHLTHSLRSERVGKL